MARYCARQKPTEEKPGENPNSTGSGYIRHGQADGTVHQIHEDDGVGGLQKRSHSTYNRNDAENPKQNILNTTAQKKKHLWLFVETLL